MVRSNMHVVQGMCFADIASHPRKVVHRKNASIFVVSTICGTVVSVLVKSKWEPGAFADQETLFG